jgi:hypothetical protein
VVVEMAEEPKVEELQLPEGVLDPAFKDWEMILVLMRIWSKVIIQMLIFLDMDLLMMGALYHHYLS